MGSRAHLLAGLRTGGPRSSSPFSAEAEFQQQQKQQQQQQQQQWEHAQLNASAAPFTPGSYTPEAHLYAQAHADAQARAHALQIESLRAQVASYQQQQQLQQLAVHQRMAAQASIQASLRQRQVQQQQMFLQMQLQQQMQQHLTYDASIEAHQENEALLHRLQYLQQLQMNASSRQTSVSESASASGVESAHSWRSASNSVLKRSSNPPKFAGERSTDNMTDLTDSMGNVSVSSAASNDKSWRSTSTSVLKGARRAAQKTSSNPSQSPPSIVVDDSASESSVSEPSDTPETSEEDISASFSKDVATPLSVPRPISLSAAPRSRTFSAEAKQGASSQGSNGGSRQPRGPPTEFLAVNFASRLSARTRREAMNRLCASPRAASFSHAIVA